MALAERRVARLHLRAPSAPLVRRGAVRIEDALRTASLPDDGARLWLVRRLDLGRLQADAGPVLLARALECAFAAAQARCVHALDTGAGLATVVWFRSAFEAHLALARRLLAGPPPIEWFWSRAVPGWRPGTPDDGLRAIARALALRPEAPVAMPQWLRTLVDEGHGPALAAALRLDERQLAHAAAKRLPGAAVPGRTAHPDPLAPIVEPRGVSTLRSANRSAAPEEARPPDIPAGMSSEAGRVGVDRPRPIRAPSRAFPAPPSRGDDDPAADATPPAPADPRTARGTAVALDESGIPWTGPDGLDTAAGGLPFLLNALVHLGYPQWLHESPDWAGCDLPRRILGDVLRRLALDPDDPAWRIAAAATLPRRLPRRFVAPAQWRHGLLSGRGALRCAGDPRGGVLLDPSGRLALGAWSGPRPRALLADIRGAVPVDVAPMPPVDRACRAWTIALRRWLRRRAGIGLRGLVLRRARLSLEPTHLQLAFPLDGADLGIRRSGLDLDPGWLPWYGRVVGFRYGRDVAP